MDLCAKVSLTVTYYTLQTKFTLCFIKKQALMHSQIAQSLCKRTSGIFVAHCEGLHEMKVADKKKRNSDVKRECIDEVVSTESMKDAEKALWFTHYDQLCDKLNDVILEKCPGCQTNEPNQLEHELCVMSSSEEQVNLCFEEAYKRVLWRNVIDHWHKKLLEFPIALNPETLIIFRESASPKDHRYKERLRKWLIESPTTEV